MLSPAPLAPVVGRPDDCRVGVVVDCRVGVVHQPRLFLHDEVEEVEQTVLKTGDPRLRTPFPRPHGGDEADSVQGDEISEALVVCVREARGVDTVDGRGSEATQGSAVEAARADQREAVLGGEVSEGYGRGFKLRLNQPRPSSRSPS